METAENPPTPMKSPTDPTCPGRQQTSPLGPAKDGSRHHPTGTAGILQYRLTKPTGDETSRAISQSPDADRPVTVSWKLPKNYLASYRIYS